MEIGANVILNDEKKKIIYRVDEISNSGIKVSGLNYRIKRTTNKNNIFTAPKSLIQQEENENKNTYYNITNSIRRGSQRYLLGTVLHIDGDANYLKRCLSLYKEVGVFSYGVNLNEGEMAKNISKIFSEINPSIVVLTGHDSYNDKGLIDLKNYKNTKNFMETVIAIRKVKTLQDCCIIAGACQSNFEALIAAGANFASSPKRINVHTYDPAVIAIKVATTSFLKQVNFKDCLKFIKGKHDAFGGVESFGKMKLIL